MLHGLVAFMLHMLLQIKVVPVHYFQILKLIHGIDVPLHILGDPAYPFYLKLMNPHADNGQLNVMQW